MKIRLDPGEMAMAQTLAVMRQFACRSDDVVNRPRDGNVQSVGMEILGAVSELAWAKAMNTYPDLALPTRSWKPDARYQGKTIDIKATTHANGKLMVLTRAKHADLYVLAIVKEECVDFVGYAVDSDVRRDELIQDHGYGPTYMLTQSQLRQFKFDEEKSA